MSNELTVSHHSSQPVSVFSTIAAFEDAQRLVKPLISSDLVPANYRGADKTGNALIALDMANRMGIPALVVMQNLHVIEGRPSWSSKFVIGALASCGLFSPVRWRITDLGEVEAEKFEWVKGDDGRNQRKTVKVKVRDKQFIAYAVEKSTGEVLEGPPVTFSMAIAEGWYYRNGSKWLTMPDLMGRYRSASMFGGLYAPHILNGMPSEDEVVDITDYRVIEPETATSTTAEPKPAGRPRGLHAAMQNGKEEPEPVKDKPAARTKPKAEPAQKVEEAEVLEDGPDADQSFADGVDNLQINSKEVDVFGSPEDDADYEPA